MAKKKSIEEIAYECEGQLSIDDLLQPTVYGYARVSTKAQAHDGNSLEYQKGLLEAAGASCIYADTYTGTTTKRPELTKMMNVLKSGDTLIVAKLDRLARTTLQGLELIEQLVEKNITVNILNMGIISSKAEDKLRLTMFLAFAQYERDMILERTREGKEMAKKNNPLYHEGRPRTYSKERIEHALELLETLSYSQVVAETGVGKRTLIRAKKKAEEEKLLT